MIEERGEMGMGGTRYWEGSSLRRMDDVSRKTVVGSSSHMIVPIG